MGLRGDVLLFGKFGKRGIRICDTAVVSTLFRCCSHLFRPSSSSRRLGLGERSCMFVCGIVTLRVCVLVSSWACCRPHVLTAVGQHLSSFCFRLLLTCQPARVTREGCTIELAFAFRALKLDSVYCTWSTGRRPTFASGAGRKFASHVRPV